MMRSTSLVLPYARSNAFASTNSISCLFYPLLLLFVVFASAEAPSFIKGQAYDEGKLGRYPIQKFKSSEALAPHINLVRQSKDCESDLLTFFAPRGYAVPGNNAQATIVNQDGHLIWTAGWPGKQFYNLMVQQYKGANYLTFWAGNDAVGGHGAGDYYMLDQTYNFTRKFSAANGLAGDLHEFRLTPQGTALITVYQVVQHDLTSLGKTVGPIWDCIIQEIDVESGKVVFEWRAAEHLNVADTYRAINGEGEPNGAAFDWFHMNSIDKDTKGNYIVSSRYLFSVTYIDGKTGKVIWILGGKRNMFKDLSDGKATKFAYQHDARWSNNYKEITLFDNSDDGPPSARSKPRGVRIKIDQDAMTAKLVYEYKNPDSIAAASQGSMQDLPGGNVMLGYGNTGAFTEFSHNGRALCDSHFGPSSHFGSGDVQSYRVLKYEWHGYPTADPDLAVAIDDGKMWRAYVSWNGATEVADWVLQGASSLDKEESQWKALEVKPKNGFETDFALEAGHPDYLRVAALDVKGNILGTSKPANAAEAKVTYTVAKSGSLTGKCRDERWIWATGVMAGCGIVALALGARLAWRLCASWRGGRQLRQYRRLSKHEQNPVSEPFA